MTTATAIQEKTIEAPTGLTTKHPIGWDFQSLSNYGREDAQSYIDSVAYKASRRINGSKSREETIFTYLYGHKLECDGRHYKRLAIAEEELSGRNMREWCEQVKLAEGTMRELLTECRTVGLLPSKDSEIINVTVEGSDTSEVASPEQLSQSMPTARAPREYAKAEPETKEWVEEKASNGEVVTAKDIKDADEKVKEKKEEAIKAELTLEQRQTEEAKRVKAEASDSANQVLDRFSEHIDELQRYADQIHPNVLKLTSIERVKEIQQKIEPLCETLFNTESLFKDELAPQEDA